MPIRIAASTVAFPELRLRDLPDHAAALGLEGYALTFGPNGSVRPDTDADELRDFQARCGALGLRVAAIYGYAGRSMFGDAVAREADRDLARRAIDLAARLGAPVCRVFAGSAPPAGDLISRFVDACRPVAEYATGAGVVLGFPTHHDLAFDPASCRELVEGLGRDRAGIIFNGQSVELDGIDPVDALRAMRDVVIQVELKDWRRSDGRSMPAPIGQGEACVWPVIETLVDQRFDGWLILHHLRQHHPELPPLERSASEAVRRVIARRT